MGPIEAFLVAVLEQLRARAAPSEVGMECAARPALDLVRNQLQPLHAEVRAHILAQGGALAAPLAFIFFFLPRMRDPLGGGFLNNYIKSPAKRYEKGKTAVILIGGGSPKNFILQTEPQIQEVLGLEESGHDYFLQITDARPDTGGLSGATPQEAMTWGKVDPNQLPDTVTCEEAVQVSAVRRW